MLQDIRKLAIFIAWTYFGKTPFCDTCLIVFREFSIKRNRDIFYYNSIRELPMMKIKKEVTNDFI